MWSTITALVLVQILTIPIHVAYFFAVQRERKKVERYAKSIWKYYQLIKKRRGSR